LKTLTGKKPSAPENVARRDENSNRRQIMKLLTATVAILGLSVYSQAGMAQTDATDDRGDRIERRLDNRGDRIERHLDQQGDRIDRRLDRKSRQADLAGRERLSDRLDRKGDVIDRRLDRRGDRIDRGLDRQGRRINRRVD
jgi:hypothetical protein